PISGPLCTLRDSGLSDYHTGDEDDESASSWCKSRRKSSGPPQPHSPRYSSILADHGKSTSGPNGLGLSDCPRTSVRNLATKFLHIGQLEEKNAAQAQRRYVCLFDFLIDIFILKFF
ncbi:unnamed protein product, partial [Protopolystoma xenopodis]